MATTVVYNDVTMHNVSTRQWDETVLYDDAGNVMAVTYNLVFQALMHAATNPITDSPTYVDGKSAGATATQVYTTVRDRLSQSRKNLEVRIGDKVAITSRPARGQNQRGVGVDVENGPRPKVLEIRKISGDKAIQVTWSVSTTITPCPASTTGKEGWILSNRWSVRESMDEDFYVTRTIDGQLRLGTSPTPGAGTNWGHAFKSLCIPGLESGFRRVTVDFTVAADGRTCNYTVVDRQTHYAAPWPATRMNGRHTVGSNDGVNFYQTVSLTLSAPPHVHISDLYQRALQVAFFRIDYKSGDRQLDPKSVVNAELANSQMLAAIEVTESIGDDNRIDLSMTVLEVYGKASSVLLILPVSRFGKLNIGSLRRQKTVKGNTFIEKKAEYVVNRSRPGNIYGYEPWVGDRNPQILALLHCFTQGPCDNGDMSIAVGTVPKKGEAGTSVEPVPTENETTVTVFEASAIDEKPVYQHVSTSGKKGMYMNCRVASRYVMSRGVLAMPLAEQGSVATNYRRSGGEPVTSSPPPRELQASAELFELSAPQAYRVFTYDCERFGGYPKLPQPLARISGANNFVALLASAEIGLPAAHPAPDGNGFVYRAKARYVYLLNRPPTSRDAIDVGRLPFFDQSADSGLTTYDALFNEKA